MKLVYILIGITVALMIRCIYAGETYEKADNTHMRIIKNTTTEVKTIVTLNELTKKMKDLLNRRDEMLAAYNTQIDEVAAQIEEARKLGIKEAVLPNPYQ